MAQHSARRTTASLAAALVAALLTSPALAGPFDCSVAYDEFDSFMNKSYLAKPEAYGPLATGRLSRDDYDSQQKGKLLLRPGREGMGVAIVQTNKNKRGKLLFTWDALPGSRRAPLLILRDVTIYDRVEDGAGMRVTREIRLATAQGVDLDTGRASAGPEADIRYHNPDPRTLLIEAVNGATVAFPTATLCKR